MIRPARRPVGVREDRAVGATRRMSLNARWRPPSAPIRVASLSGCQRRPGRRGRRTRHRPAPGRSARPKFPYAPGLGCAETVKRRSPAMGAFDPASAWVAGAVVADQAGPVLARLRSSGSRAGVEQLRRLVGGHADRDRAPAARAVDRGGRGARGAGGRPSRPASRAEGQHRRPPNPGRGATTRSPRGRGGTAARRRGWASASRGPWGAAALAGGGSRATIARASRQRHPVDEQGAPAPRAGRDAAASALRREAGRARASVSRHSRAAAAGQGRRGGR